MTRPLVRRPRPAFLLCALVAPLVLAPAPAAAQADPLPPLPGPEPEIQEVTFPGATSLDPDILLAAIETRPTDCRNLLVALPCLLGDWDWAEVRRTLPDTAQVREDVERLVTLYEIWGYPHASVRPELSFDGDGDALVAFHVTEGDPLTVASLELRGLDALDPPVRVPRPLPLQPGEPYALPRLEATEELVVGAFAERGHPYATVTIGGTVNEAAARATITMDVDPGPAVTFGPVTVDATAPLEDGVVRERLTYAPGDPFRPSALAASERALYALPIVERAVAQAAGLDRGATAIPTRYLVEPRPVQGFDVEGTVSSTDCLEAGVFWRHRYFLGGPRTLALGVVGSNLLAGQAGGDFPCGSTGTGPYADVNHSVEAELWQPWPGSPATTVRLRGWSARISSPEVFVREGFGGSLAVGRELAPGLGLQLQYEAGRNELSAAGAYFCGGYGVCEATAIDQLSAPNTLAMAGLTLLYSSAPGAPEIREPDVSPGRAWTPDLVPDWRLEGQLAVDGAGAATASDYAFGRVLAEGAVTRVLGRAGEVAARLRGGLLLGDDVLPPEVRFFSGGPYTVRGVEQNLVGPGVVLLERGAPGPSGCILLPGAPCDQRVNTDSATFRPVGGDRLLEASVEGRLWVTETLQAAAFVDYGLVSQEVGALWERTEGRVTYHAVTPGLGIRVITDLGPIRLDVGYDLSGPRERPLLRFAEGGDLDVLGRFEWDPYGWDDPGFFTSLYRRLQLHMAIGQPF